MGGDILWYAISSMAVLVIDLRANSFVDSKLGLELLDPFIKWVTNALRMFCALGGGESSRIHAVCTYLLKDG
jgi:hypothetical protein